MNQRRVNRLQTCLSRSLRVYLRHNRSGWFLRHSRLFPALLLTACASLSSVPPALAPWKVLGLLATAAPHDSPGLWTDGAKTLLAWPGEPSSPGIRLVDTNAPDQVKVLTLG